MTDKQQRAIPMSGLERRLRERGSIDGQRELLLTLLRTRFGELDDELVARVEAGSKEQIERWAERMVRGAPETPEDVLA